MQFLKFLLKFLCQLCFRVEVKGLEHYQQAGKRVLIIANHTSFLDAVLLTAFLPDRLTFAVNTFIAEKWWLRPIKNWVDLFPMDPANPFSIKSMIRYVQQDKKAVIFPEGRITVTGSLMKVYPGPAIIADKSGAKLLPIRIEGAQYSYFSRLKGLVKQQLFPKITLTISPVMDFHLPEHLYGRERRRHASKILQDLMVEMMFSTSEYQQTLLDALIDASEIHGKDKIVTEDIARVGHSYHDLLLRSIILGKLLHKISANQDYIGVMLPNANVALVSFFGLQFYGKVPAMLNFTQGAKGVLSACQVAKITTVITSRRFVQMGKLEEMMEQLAKEVTVYYLEDFTQQLTLWHKLSAWWQVKSVRRYYHWLTNKRDPNQAAVILFTSGSEGTPKGVVLSHSNLLANREQMLSRLDLGASDQILNALPPFHSFGLMAGTLLPLMTGMRVFLYPSPLHYRIVPEIVYEANATVLLGTNTFLTGYAKFAHPYDFYRVHYVFAGAEKLKQDTKRIWFEKFGLRILEGYGATETSPILSVNDPMNYQPDTVGRLLPAIEYQLESVTGIKQGGRLHVKGPNVMLGYLKIDNPGVLQAPKSCFGEGWYDTGDIVEFDVQGCIKIVGRAKRFAKIGGEMVSLTSVEEWLSQVYPDQCHAVINIPDEKKGEQLILVSTEKTADRKYLQQQAKQAGLSELHLPRQIIITQKMPLLGSGKIDYTEAGNLVNTELNL